MTAVIDLAGQRFGMLVVAERVGSDKDGQALWLCRCDCGTERPVRGGSIRKGTSRSCGCQTLPRSNEATTKAVVTYSGLHARLGRRRGRADAHPCVDCGRRAGDWSYTRDDPNELTEQVGRWRVRYSLDIERYVPRCRPCHNRHDHAAVAS